MIRRTGLRFLATLALAAGLAACGGGGGGADSAATPAPPAPPVVEKPATRNDAARFLTQATFGPTDADIDRVMAVGYAAWIDEQHALPASSHRTWWETRDAQVRAANTGVGGHEHFIESFWKQAVTGPDQLRQRTAFALSQIFVISMVDDNVGNDPRAAAAWLDMLGEQGFGRYRTLLESVSRHPLMGFYLSHLRNQKANPTTGRVPDENYSREVMQLFSIGLVALNEDGSARRDAGGAAIETYEPADITGLAKVFTGFSWACPDWANNNCFFNGSNDGISDPDRGFKPMLGYPQYHALDAKTFLGTTIPAQTPGNPEASLAAALDALAAHPNVGPFIGRQLIQRFVTGNPSPAYVRDISRVWADNGTGVRGDLKAVVKAILMHPEARMVSDTSGKLREPVLKLSAFLRAFGHTSDTGFWRVGNTDNASTALGQTPLRSPSVFNFYRPGYVAPGTQSAARALVAPELQIATETSAAGYVNFMRDNVSSGVGAFNGTVAGVALNRRDIQASYASELALVGDPAALVAQVASKLSYGQLGATAQADIATAVASIAIPALNSSGSNQAQVDATRRSRVHAAVLMVLATPEFQVQR